MPSHMTCAADHYFSESPQHDSDVFVLEHRRIVGEGGHLHVVECLAIHPLSSLSSSLPVHNSQLCPHQVYHKQL